MSELSVADIEKIITRTEVADMTKAGDTLWVRRMAEALHAKQYAVPAPLVIMHYAVGCFGFPTLYISAPGALVLSVDDNVPDDRVFQCETVAIPAALLESIKGAPVGRLGDSAEKDALARQAIATMNGGKPALTVLPGGLPRTTPEDAGEAP